MKLSVDYTLCLSTGLCTGLAPDVLELDESGSLVLLDEQPDADIAEDVRDAVRSCPVQALILTEDAAP